MNRFFIAALLCLLPPLAQAGVIIQNWVAASGARVYFVESHDLPIVDLSIDFAAGTAYDSADKAGLAAFTRGLLDAGAGNLDEEAIAEKQVDTGAQLGGHTDLDRSGVSLRTLSSARERDAAVDLVRLLLAQPTFPQAVFEREKGRSIAAIKESETQPASIAAKRFARGLYPTHPYGQTATAESVGRISRDDVAKFHRSFFTASRAVVAIVGDLTRAEADAIVLRLTEGLPKSDNSAVIAPPAAPRAETIRVSHPSQQSHIQVGMPVLKRGDPDFFPLVVGNYVLGGGGFVSRLMKEVREKRGFAYSVASYFQPQQVEGPFQIGLQTKNEQADEALKVARETLESFLKQGPTEDELRGAKQNITDGFVLRLDSNRKILDQVAVIAFYQLPLTYLDDYTRQVEKVTAQQIREAFSRRVRPGDMVTVVVGGGA
ncbi:MAG: insulinase family protein [Sterolibacteriaceae bacterium]|nr:insulinase family protein [Candidatus Methylophosphatis haderslevensis]